eukprot:12137210-Heterocapsa_arctica.AAC.1
MHRREGHGEPTSEAGGTELKCSKSAKIGRAQEREIIGENRTDMGYQSGSLSCGRPNDATGVHGERGMRPSGRETVAHSDHCEAEA